jgi:hypothetical protein
MSSNTVSNTTIDVLSKVPSKVVDHSKVFDHSKVLQSQKIVKTNDVVKPGEISGRENIVNYLNSEDYLRILQNIDKKFQHDKTHRVLSYVITNQLGGIDIIKELWKSNLIMIFHGICPTFNGKEDKTFSGFVPIKSVKDKNDGTIHTGILFDLFHLKKFIDQKQCKTKYFQQLVEHILNDSFNKFFSEIKRDYVESFDDEVLVNTVFDFIQNLESKTDDFNNRKIAILYAVIGWRFISDEKKTNDETIRKKNIQKALDNLNHFPEAKYLLAIIFDVILPRIKNDQIDIVVNDEKNVLENAIKENNVPENVIVVDDYVSTYIMNDYAIGAYSTLFLKDGMLVYANTMIRILIQFNGSFFPTYLVRSMNTNNNFYWIQNVWGLMEFIEVMPDLIFNVNSLVDFNILKITINEDGSFSFTSEMRSIQII